MLPIRHRPFVYLFGSYVTGILFALYRPVSLFVLSIFFTVLWIITFMSRTRRRLCFVSVCLLFTFLGAFALYARHVVDEDHVTRIAKYYRYQMICVRGVIESEVTLKKSARGAKQQCVLKLKSYQAPWGWRICSGKVQLNVFQPAALRYGQVVETVGRLHVPFSFDARSRSSYREYLRHRDIHYLLSVKRGNDLVVLKQDQGHSLKASILSLRDFLKELSDDHFSETESSLIKAMFLGDRTDLPKHIKQLFAVTGTAHVLAISGLHIGIISGLIWLISQPLSFQRSQHIVMRIIFLLFYVSLCGGRVSVSRASIMAITVLLSYLFDRDVDGLNLVCFSALLILIWNPYLILDIGFQLSFTCLLSILFLSQYVRQLITHFCPVKHTFVKWLLYSFSLSMGIWIGVLGLIAYYFHMVSPIAIVANMIVVPMMTVIVVLGAFFLICGWWCPSFVWPIIPLLKFVLMIFLTGIKMLASIPGSYHHVRGIKTWHVFLYYGVICSGILLREVLKKQRQ